MKWRRVDNPDVLDQRGAAAGAASAGAASRRAVGSASSGWSSSCSSSSWAAAGAARPSTSPPASATAAAGAGRPIPAGQDPERDLKDFSTSVFTDVQGSWEKTFRSESKPYDHAKLVLFRGGVSTGCGSASSAVGPFYCPPDQRVYLDLSFYDQMARQLGASGDFAWAYVIAHEMGHHVQQQLGTSDQVARLQHDDPGAAQRALRAPGAPGGLLRGRLGARRVQARRAGGRRPARRRSAPRRRWATTACSAARAGRSTPTPSRTARPRSASTGSGRGFADGDAGACDTFAADQV